MTSDYSDTLLAHAIILSGLVVSIRRPDVGSSGFSTGVLMGLGLFVKHNVVALPIAFALWLLVKDRRACARFVYGGLLTAALGLSACVIVFGPDFISSLLAPRVYSVMRSYQLGVILLVPMQLLIAIVMLGTINDVRNRFSLLFFLYASVALIIGVIVLSGDGVSENAVFDLVIALSLASGYFIGTWRGQSIRLWGIGVSIATLLIGTAVVGNRDVYLVWPWIEKERKAALVTQQVVSFIADRPGAAACMALVLCYWAGKPFEFDSFNFTQAVLAGRRDDSAFLERLTSGYLSTVQIAPSPFFPFPTPTILETLASRYEAEKVGELVIYVYAEKPGQTPSF